MAQDTFVHHQGGVSRGESNAHLVKLLEQSSRALEAKLREAYAPGPIPSSDDLWDSPIFPYGS